MWPSGKLIVWLGCLCVLLAAVSPSVLADTTVYGKVGGEAVLAPPANSVTGTITQILWKEDNNKAMEWEKAETNVTSVSAYRQFVERGRLDTSTGVMTISGLLYDDSNCYKPEINYKQLTAVCLNVLSPVPVPNVNKSCNESQCELICEGNTTRAAPVNYIWTSNDTGMTVSFEKQYTVYESQVSSSSSNKFICEIQNPISRERSKPIIISSNSFSSIPPPEGGPKISLGVTVLIVLLVVLILLVAFHKWKTGTWFYEKESMPWDGDFWKREGRQREAPAANGAPARTKNEKTEEEMPMRDS